MRRTLVGVSLAALVSSVCGGSGGSGGSPTSPGSTTTSVTVSLRDVVLVGTTATATATATQSNGQTQSVSATWRSDAPAVATVADSGVVTGVANGEATIIAAFGGREGTKKIRVAPNYAGNWSGMQILTSCSATGDFIGICEDNPDLVGSAFSIGLSARQPGELTVSGEFTLEDLPFPTFTAPVESDGAIKFSSTTTVEGIRAEVAWEMNSAVNGRATGSIREKYTFPGILSGDVTLDSTLSEFNRTGAAAATLRRTGPLTNRKIRALLRR